MLGPAGVLDTESADAFYSRIYRRLMLIMTALGLAGTTAAWIRFRPPIALGFLAGSIIAMLNFHWLALTIQAAGAKAEASAGQSGRAGVVLRFILRYLLIALAAYAIFRGSADGLYGLFAGLSLPVGAILIEAGHEIYRALRAGI